MKIVEGYEISPQVGSYVKRDGKWIGEKLLAGDKPVDEGYKGSQYRYPTPNLAPIIKSLPINIEITGRTLQYRDNSCFVRIKIWWVGDCEADESSKGWLMVNPYELKLAS